MWPGFLCRRGRSPGIRLIPRPVLTVAGVFNPVIRKLMKCSHQKEEPYVVEGSAFQRKFGLSPVRLEEGVRRTLEWYRGFSTYSPQAPGL